MEKAIEYCERTLDQVESYRQATRSDKLRSKIGDAYCAKGYFLLQNGEDIRALNTFNKVKDYASDDTYSKISNAIIHYNSSNVCKESKNLDRSKLILNFQF